MDENQLLYMLINLNYCETLIILEFMLVLQILTYQQQSINHEQQSQINQSINKQISQSINQSIYRNKQITPKSQYISYINMYDIGREIDPSLCQLINNQLCYYIGGSRGGRVQAVKRRAHHYPQQACISEMVENICRQVFYYSSSLQKVSARYEQQMVRSVLLENVKRITVHNCDKYGMVPEQRLFYLIISYMHVQIADKAHNLSSFLVQLHYLMTSNAWRQPDEEIPFSLLMLLNSQFQQLLSYAREQLITRSPSVLLQNLIDLLIYNIELSEHTKNSNNIMPSCSNQNPTTTKTQSSQLISSLKQQVNDSEWIKLLITQIKKKSNNNNVFALLNESKQEIQVILGVLAGNQAVIEELAKGSWGLYMNLYINYVGAHKDCSNNHTNITTINNNSYEQIITTYTKKHSQHPLPACQQFLIKLITHPSRTSFHQLYQQSFNLLSPILSHLMGLLMLQCRLVDMHSLINNNDYYQQILLNVIDDCSSIGWGSFVHVVGFANNKRSLGGDKGYNSMSDNNTSGMGGKCGIQWEDLMHRHLPYQIQQHNIHNPLYNQIKQIQEKLQDLNIVGLSSLTKSYLTTLFTLQLSNSLNRLNPPILQVFFLILEMTDSSTANNTFHQMKSFLGQYYRDCYFDYSLLEWLQSIFERKRTILSEKMEGKIEKLFSLPYKIRVVYQRDNADMTGYEQQSRVLIEQLKEFNKLFMTSKNKKAISLSVQLLRLARIIHKRVETTIGFDTETGMMEIQSPDLKHVHEQEQHQQHATVAKGDNLHLARQFHINLSNYLQQWRAFSQHQQLSLSQHAMHQLAYFDQYFY